MDKELSKESVERYCRQIILPEIGKEGQLKIQNSKILVIGSGGLGSPCLMYLAGAGIGIIGIVDGDNVDLSNLHRQIIHSTSNKGVNKAKSAEMLIHSFNPDIKVITYEEHLNNKNAISICQEYDLLVDCTDNPGTRYLINDCAVTLNIPLVSGSAILWDGQLTVYHKSTIDRANFDDKLPCYRCLFPIPTPNSAVCTCSDSGVFGPTPGVIGTLQANEAVKLILGHKDKILSKRMLIYDGFNMTFKVIKLRSNKDDCIVCGTNPKLNKDNIKDFDYNEFVNPKECRIEKRVQLPSNNEITWKKLKTDFNPDNTLYLDVRTKEQYDMINLPGYINIPLEDLTKNINKYEEEKIIDKEKNIVILCRAGNFSTHAVKNLLSRGYEKVYNVVDGLHSYIREVDDNMPFY
jgi:adenylyltransferase/sulfurtransferase